MVQMPVIWRVQTFVNRIAWFIWIISSHKCCVWKGNSYKCIFNKVRRKNNCACLFIANLSLHIFSKSWQYYFNAKRWFVLAQAVSKPGPMYAHEVVHNEMKAEILWHFTFSGCFYPKFFTLIKNKFLLSLIESFLVEHMWRMQTSSNI